MANKKILIYIYNVVWFVLADILLVNGNELN